MTELLSNRSELPHFWFHESLFKPFDGILSSTSCSSDDQEQVSMINRWCYCYNMFGGNIGTNQFVEFTFDYLRNLFFSPDINNPFSTGGDSFDKHQVGLAANIFCLEKHASGFSQGYGRVGPRPQASSNTRHTLGFPNEQELVSVRIRCRAVHPNTSPVRTWVGGQRKLRRQPKRFRKQREE